MTGTARAAPEDESHEDEKDGGNSNYKALSVHTPGTIPTLSKSQDPQLTCKLHF